MKNRIFLRLEEGRVQIPLRFLFVWSDQSPSCLLRPLRDYGMYDRGLAAAMGKWTSLGELP